MMNAPVANATLAGYVELARYLNEVVIPDLLDQSDPVERGVATVQMMEITSHVESARAKFVLSENTREDVA